VKRACKPKESKSNSHNNRQVSQKIHFGFEPLLALITLCLHIEYYRTSLIMFPLRCNFNRSVSAANS